jgi:hypothetical protein
VNKATPTITWSNPADINEGTTLSSTQLNAVASVPGSFVYNPPAGTLLVVGTQTLHTDFTPTDAADYITASKDVSINVINVPPIVTITGPTVGSVYPINTPVTFTGTYTDPGTAETFTAQWTFDSITTPVQTVSGGSVSTPYTFTAPGVYKVKLAVTDSNGGIGTTTTINGQEDFVVIYEPNAGFVTGGGWINSPAGAYVPNPSLTGRVNFGFVSKYQKGATAPTGETEFDFQMGNLNFHSASYNYLVISEARAQYMGTCTINGAGNYKFWLTALDGQITGGGGTDGFRVKIVDAAGTVVYDNEIASDTDTSLSSPVEPISGGSIKIHTR